MSQFFNLFPRIEYDVNNSQYSTYDAITNITFRVRFVRDLLNNIYSYTPYTIREGDTPEILADKVYGNPEAHWMILYANDMLDPQYDWPLDTRSFNNYIKKKYGSLETAQTTIHHYEKIITYHNSQTNSSTVNRYVIDEEQLTDNSPGSQYITYDNMAGYEEIIYNLDGATIREVRTKEAISVFDWELQKNEAKREIKIIKKDYYNQIMSELRALTKIDMNAYRRV